MTTVQHTASGLNSNHNAMMPIGQAQSNDSSSGRTKKQDQLRDELLQLEDQLSKLTMRRRFSPSSGPDSSSLDTEIEAKTKEKVLLERKLRKMMLNQTRQRRHRDKKRSQIQQTSSDSFSDSQTSGSPVGIIPSNSAPVLSNQFLSCASNVNTSGLMSLTNAASELLDNYQATAVQPCQPVPSIALFNRNVPQRTGQFGPPPVSLASPMTASQAHIPVFAAINTPPPPPTSQQATSMVRVVVPKPYASSTAEVDAVRGGEREFLNRLFSVVSRDLNSGDNYRAAQMMISQRLDFLRDQNSSKIS
jgi:hypothetical protein